MGEKNPITFNGAFYPECVYFWGAVKDGKLASWDVTPAEREEEVVICGATDR